MFFDQPSQGLQHRSAAAAATQRAPQADAPPPQALQRQRRQRNGFLGQLFQLPLLVVRASLKLVFEVVHFGYKCTTTVGNIVLPRSVTRALQGAAESLLQGNRIEDPPRSAASFKQTMQQRYGTSCPEFLETSWQDAAAQAHRQYKFLLVYLHSADHEDTDQFCHQTLCDPTFTHYVSENFLCWGGDVRKTDAFTFSSMLHVSRYPYIGLLSGSGNRTKRVAASEGFATPADLMQVLQPAVEQHGAQFVADQADHNERELNRRLREEQDADYQRSLEADRERERKRAADRAEEEARQLAAQQAQDAQRAEREAVEQRKADLASALERRKASKKAGLQAEPAAGSLNTAAIRIRLPDGSTAQRRFLADQPLQVVYDFADSLEGLNSLKYSLATMHPKVVYGSDKLQQSLSELSLAPQAVLLVQPHDDD
ncbi:hypothetical protein ABBQ32_011205 [Trebouxia sp. C0010 RCD-2024]